MGLRMSAVWDRQKALAEALTAAGVKTMAALPEKAAPPLRYILRGEVNAGQTFGSFVATFQVLCVGRAGQNAAVAEQVDDLAAAVVRAVPKLADFALGSPATGEPGDFMLNGQPHLAVPVTVTARISRADMEG